MSRRLLTCPEERLLEEFIEGELGESDVEAVAAHLNECAACRRRVDGVPDLAALADDLRSASVKQVETQVDVGVPLARLNELIPDYELLGEIGRGGMGIVYKARQRALNRVVALKVLPALLGAVRRDALLRFRREAELAARLKHTNIISVYDYGEVEGTLYYAMELVEGRSLREMLREIAESGATDVVMGGELGGSRDHRSCEIPISHARLPESLPASAVSREGIPADMGARKDSRTSKIPTHSGTRTGAGRSYYRRAAEWIADVADALHEAHEQGVIHRDVKPSNLLLAKDGKLMISDFGLARAGGFDSVTQSGALLGTCRYMSPEQVDSSAGQIDRRVDVYALGATLYELLALRPMFASADDREVLNHVLHVEPAPPRRFVRQTPRDLETICLKAVEKDRDKRYVTAKDMADDLRRWLLDLPIHAQRPSWPSRATKFARRRKLAVALTTATALFFATSAVVFSAYRNSQADAQLARATAFTQELELIRRDAEEKRDQGKLLDALARVENGLKLDSQSEALELLKARTLLSLDRVADARTTLEALVERHPDSLRGHFLLGRILGPRGRLPTDLIYDRPESALDLSAQERAARFAHHREQVARLAPDSEEHYFLKAEDEADPHRAVELLNRALELSPNGVDALSARIARHKQLGDYAAVLLDAERLIASYPDWPTAYVDKGLALSRLGRLNEAEAAYSEAIHIQPENASFRSNRGAVKYRLGRYAEALADANEAIKIDPDYPYFYAVRAQALAGLGNIDEAMADFSRALQLDPSQKEIYFGRAEIVMSLGHFEEVIADMSRVNQLDPEDTRALRVRAQAYNALKKYERAITDLNAAIRIQPDAPESYRERRVSYFYSGDVAAALADCTRAIELNPGNAGDYRTRVLLNLNAQQYAAMIQDLSWLLERQPDSDDVLFYRALAYEMANAPTLAQADLDRLIEKGGPVRDYAELWLYVLLRLHLDDAAAVQPLAGHAPAPDNGSWTSALFEFFADRITAESLLKAAATEAETCEAHYYIGAKALIEGRHADAREAFQTCMNLNRSNVTESDFARARLAQLDKSGENAISPAPRSFAPQTAP